jgi:hypothetical protein
MCAYLVYVNRHGGWMFSMLRKCAFTLVLKVAMYVHT